MSDLVILVTEAQRQIIEKQARQHGFPTPAEYLLSLVDEDVDQAYFWSEHWQRGEREADADIAAGRVETFDSMDDLLSDLYSVTIGTT